MNLGESLTEVAGVSMEDEPALAVGSGLWMQRVRAESELRAVLADDEVLEPEGRLSLPFNSRRRSPLGDVGAGKSMKDC